MKYRARAIIASFALPLLLGCGVRLPLAPIKGDPLVESQHIEELIEKGSTEITSVRALYRGTLITGDRRSAGRYVLAYEVPFKARVEVLSHAIGTALLLGVFDHEGGTIVDGATGKEYEVTEPRIPILEGGNEYDLRILLPILFGRIPSDSTPTSYAQSGTETQVECLRDGLLVEIAPLFGTIEKAYFLSSDKKRVQAEVELGDYRVVQGIAIPHSVRLREYESNSSAEFVLQSVSLNKDIPDEIFKFK